MAGCYAAVTPQAHAQKLTSVGGAPLEVLPAFIKGRFSFWELIRVLLLGYLARSELTNAKQIPLVSLRSSE
jgi:hypothetical protein